MTHETAMNSDTGHPPSDQPDPTRHFDFSVMDGAARYRLLASTIMPRPIAWITSCSTDGAINAAPYSFFNFFGSDKPVVAIGILRQPGAEKDTAANIRATGEFVVNLVSFSLAEAMNITCIDAPASVNELTLAGLATAASIAVQPPRIAASPAAFECKVLHLLDTGPGQLLVVGEILHAHYAADVLTGAPDHPRIDAAKLDLIGRMHGASAYVRTTDIFHLARPAWASSAEPRGHSDRKE